MFPHHLRPTTTTTEREREEFFFLEKFLIIIFISLIEVCHHNEIFLELISFVVFGGAGAAVY